LSKTKAPVKGAAASPAAAKASAKRGRKPAGSKGAGSKAAKAPATVAAAAVEVDGASAAKVAAPRVPTNVAKPIATREEPATYVPMERESLAEFVQRRTAEAEVAAERDRRRAEAAKAVAVTPRQAERTRVAMRQLMQHHFAAEQIAKKQRARESAVATRELAARQQARMDRMGVSSPDLGAAKAVADERAREEASEAEMYQRRAAASATAPTEASITPPAADVDESSAPRPTDHGAPPQ